MTCPTAHRPNAVDGCTAVQRRDLTWALKKGILFLIQRINSYSVPDLAQLCHAEDRECGIGTRAPNKSGLYIHSSEYKDF